ncbi:hypothetical protein CTAYLR_000686 [Chrysophaeum taylorii]|uniref:Protein-serine/threonine kinase n=1 Tax=Chrysophaeum taylorii TaxID=2483200 RepID=A0AAD7U8N6_9STRA|nr:hypothetical protein CTAYLR_000686 [Chrysophaeum taylorii]
MIHRRFLGTSSDVVTRLSRQRQTGVSLRGLLAAGREHLRQLPEVSPTPMLLTVAAFLHRELPIRLARRVAELDRLPSLYAMPSVKLVREWYAQSAIEIFESERPVDPLSEERFARLIDAIYERHAAVLITMAKGAHELRSSMKERFAFELDLQIHQFLDSFYTSRIGIRVIIGQYLALRQCTPQSTRIGLLDTQVVPAQVAVDAVDQATMLCERQFGVAPEVELHGRLDLAFSYVPDHLYYIMLELLKNSMRATVEQHAKLVGEVDHKTLAPVKVVVADGEENEDVALKVSDEGGGIARSHMPRVWSYLFTTASHEVQERGFLDTNSRSSDFGGAPLAGLGYGLPISRAYARYFGGDVTLMSMEGYGTDAYVYLSRLGDHDEPLP